MGGPVSPEERVLKQSEGKRVRQLTFNHHLPENTQHVTVLKKTHHPASKTLKVALHIPEGAVQVGAVDEAVLGVGPVQFLLAVVQRQPVGPVDLLIDDHGAICPVHARPLNLWDLAPISPVHEAEDTEKRPSQRHETLITPH